MAEASQAVVSASTGQRNNLAGILAMMAASACFVSNDSIVKVLGAHLPVGEIIALRGLIATLMLLAATLWFGAARWPVGALTRASFGLLLAGQVGSTLTFVVALMHMKLADANGIQQFQPLAITAAAAVFLAEPVGWRRWMAAAAGLIGVLLIIKPGTGAFEPYALVQIACVLFVVMRDLGNRGVAAGVPSLLLALASAVAVTASGMAMGAGETWLLPLPPEWLAFGAASVLLVGGYLFSTTAMRRGELSVVTPFRYTSAIWAVLLQVAVWDDTPDRWTLSGIGIVVAAGLYTFHREQLRRATSPA